MSDITLKLDESNDVRFDVSITAQENIGGPEGPQIDTRFICEADGFEYCFRGTIADDGSTQVVIPPMKGIIGEGVYHTRLEVIVDGRHFIPLQLETKFAQSMRVVAEGVRVMNSDTKANSSGDITVSVKPSTSRNVRVVNETPKQKKNIGARSNIPKRHDKLNEMDRLMKEL